MNTTSTNVTSCVVPLLARLTTAVVHRDQTGVDVGVGAVPVPCSAPLPPVPTTCCASTVAWLAAKASLISFTRAAGKTWRRKPSSSMARQGRAPIQLIHA